MTTAVPFHLVSQRSRGRVMIKVEGALDAVTAARTDVVVELAMWNPPPSRRVVLDLSRVSACDRAGLQTLVKAQRLARLNDVALSIVLPEGSALEALTAGGLR